MEDKNYLTEAFRAFEDLKEEVFDISVDNNIENAKEFIEKPVEELEIVYDPLVTDEQKLEDSYIGKAILQCQICQSMLYKDPSEVIIDEEAELANVEEACPYCQSEDGFKVIGQVAEFCEKCAEGEHCEECEHAEDSEEKDDLEVEESLKNIIKESLQNDEDKFDLVSTLYEKVAPIFRVYTKKGVSLKDAEIALEMVLSHLEDDETIDWSDLEERFKEALKSIKRDDIDADADDKKEKAEAEKEKADDDADADRDYKLKRDGLKESKALKEMDNVYDVKTKQGHTFLVKAKDEDSAKDWVNKNYRKTVKGDFDINKPTKTNKTNISESDKPAAISIEDAQKWVDYDMKKYGRISDRTNRLVKKAGFQILKDDHGDYEVAAGKFESCNESKIEGPRGTFEIVEKSKDELEKDGFGYHHTFQKDGKNYDVFTKEDTAVAILKEDFNKVDIETDKEKMSMTAEENGKVIVTTEPKEDTKKEKEEVIEPVSDEVKAEFKTTEEENKEDEYADIDIDEFDEEEFDSLGEQYLKRVYENVKSFKTTKGSVNGNNLKLEGIITFKSGKEAKTNFVFESKTVTKTGKLKFIGENKQFAKGKKSFTLTGKMDGNKLICESFNYNYVARDPKGKSKRLYGTINR